MSLDGGDYNNGFFGEQLGGQRAAIDVPLDAVKEFQVVATGASAEFGRTAGGIINVISKSGTNDVHGSAFYFLRHENLSANTEDGKPLKDFMRVAIRRHHRRPHSKRQGLLFPVLRRCPRKTHRENLSVPLGAACSVTNPVITNPAHETAINGSAECQRVALLNFFRTSRNQEEGLPTQHDINNNAFLGKLDWELNSANKLARFVQL